MHYACTRNPPRTADYVGLVGFGAPIQLIDVFLKQSQKQRLFLSLGNSVHKWMFVATVAEKAYVLDRRPDVSRCAKWRKGMLGIN